MDIVCIFRKFGSATYYDTVAIPSLCGYWANVSYNRYYSQPWEYIADRLGGVERTRSEGYVYAPGADAIGRVYYVFTQLISWFL